MQCPCCIQSSGDGFHPGHRSPHATIYSPGPPQHIVHQGFTYSLSPSPVSTPQVAQAHHFHTKQQIHLHHPMHQQPLVRHTLHQPHVHIPVQQSQRGAFAPAHRCTSSQGIPRRALFAHSPHRHCTSPMAASPTSYMRVVSPLQVASPQLHSPEVSSTVSTPASSDKCHHRHFIVQGFHSANVSTCALSNSDTESECSNEVARINVFKDPNRFLSTTRIPPPRTSCDEVEDGTVCESKREGEKQEQRGRGGESHKLPGTFREDAFGESFESEKDPASAQQKQYQNKIEDKQEASPDKEEAFTDQQERCQRQAEEKQTASPDKEETFTDQQERCQRQAEEKQTASPDKEQTLTDQQERCQRQAEEKQTASPDKEETFTDQQERCQRQTEEKQTASPDKKLTSAAQQKQYQRQTEVKQTASPDKKLTSAAQQKQYQRQTEVKQTASPDKKLTSAAQQKQYQRQTEVKQKATVSKKKPATRRARVCMPKISRAKRLKVEVDADSDESLMAVVTQMQPPLENSSANDPKFTSSPRAGRKRNWHNKSLSSDEDEDHNPSSVPLRSSMKGVESVVLPSLVQGPEKPVEKPPLAKPEQQLRNWYFNVCGSAVIVEGERVDDGSNTIWHSGPIVEREGRYRIKTKSGSVYVLIGTINAQQAMERGAPASLVLKFKRGFPEDWEHLFQKYYKSFRNAHRSAKKRASSDQSKGGSTLSTEPNNGGGASTPAVESMKGGGERSEHQKLKHSSPNRHDVGPALLSTGSRSLALVKQETAMMTPSMDEGLDEVESSSSLRRSRRGRLLKLPGMKVEYDFFGNILNLESLDNSVASDTSMYLHFIQRRRKKKVAPHSSRQQGSHSGESSRGKVDESSEEENMVGDHIVATSARATRKKSQLKNKGMPLKKKKSFTQQWTGRLHEQEDSDEHDESDLFPARAESRVSIRSSLCKTPGLSHSGLPSQIQTPVSGRRVRFSDVHEHGPYGSTTYSLGDTTASSSTEDTAEDVADDEEEEEEEGGEEAEKQGEGSIDESYDVEKDVGDTMGKTDEQDGREEEGSDEKKDGGENVRMGKRSKKGKEEGRCTMKQVAEELREEEDEQVAEENCAVESGAAKQNESTENKSAAVDEIREVVSVAENSMETEGVTDIKVQIIHSDSDPQETSEDYVKEIDKAIEQVVAAVTDHMADRQQSSDEFSSQNENPQDVIFLHDPRRRSHRVRKFPNRGNVINWDFLSGVRGVPLNEQPDEPAKKRGRSKNATANGLSARRRQHMPVIALDTESEDVSTEEVPSAIGEENTSANESKPRRRGRPPLHSRSEEVPSAIGEENTSANEDKPRRRGRPPLHSQIQGTNRQKREKPPVHARDVASSAVASGQNTALAAALTLPVQDLAQSDISIEEEKVELKGWSEEAVDHLLRAVSKVPASLPNFWQTVSQDLQLVYSAEECQRMYQGLVPSLPSTTAEKKTKKYDGTPVVTGKKGTLKRKTQIQELIQQSEMGYSDDLLDLTPFREKTLRVPGAVSDSEDGWEDDEVSNALLHTPANSLKKLMKVPSQDTPTLCRELDSPDFRPQTSRTEANRKVFQLQKAPKRHGAGLSKAQTKGKKQTVAAAVNAKQSTKWSKLLACLAAAQSKVAEQINAVDQDPEDGSSDHYCSNVEGEEEGSDMDLL